MYNAAVWLREIQAHRDEGVEVRWRCFPLEQVNSDDDEWLFWEQEPEDARSLRAFLAAEAARDQGDGLVQDFIFNLLELVHGSKKPVQDMATIEEAAGQVSGLDVSRMVNDMQNPELRQRIKLDYEDGVERQGVFGTPTLLFDGGDAIFLKMNAPPGEEALSLLESLRTLSVERPYVRELKKPRRPE